MQTKARSCQAVQSTRKEINDWFDALPRIYKSKLIYMGRMWILHGIDHFEAMCSIKDALDNGFIKFNIIHNRFEAIEDLLFELADGLHFIGVWTPPSYTKPHRTALQSWGGMVKDMLLGYQEAKIYHNLANLPDLLEKALKR